MARANTNGGQSLPGVVRRRSWVDAVVDAVDRAPGPAWLTYLLIGGLTAVVSIGLVVGEGVTVTPFLVYYSVAGVYALALIHHLRHAARSAAEGYRRVIPETRVAEGETLRRRLTSLPALPTAIASAIGVVGGFLILAGGGPIEDQMRAAGLATGPAASMVNVALYVFNWAATGALILYVIDQSLMIDRMARLGEVDLFDQAPLHAFSWLSGGSVIGLAVLVYVPVLLLPDPGNAAAWIIQRTAIGVVLAFVFLWPLWGSHRLLEAERGRLLRRSVDRWARFYADLHGRLDRDEHGVTDAMRNEVDTLEREQRALRATSTWPWPADLIPTVFGTVFLPLLLSVLLALVSGLLPE